MYKERTHTNIKRTKHRYADFHVGQSQGRGRARRTNHKAEAELGGPIPRRFPPIALAHRHRLPNPDFVTTNPLQRLSLIIIGLVAACADTAPTSAEIETGIQFAEDQAFRRETLLDALIFTDNTYAADRLAHYAVEEGWDNLPERSPAVLGTDLKPITFDPVPWTHEALLELGQQAFEHFPMRQDPRLDVIHTAPNEARAAGFHLDAQGGNVAQLQDPTADGVNNPSNIPDLRVVRFQDRLHWTGAVKNSLPALTIRVDTLLIESTGRTARPPRQVSFAIAYYLWHLWSPAKITAPNVFQQTCAPCHDVGGRPNGTLSAQEVGTDIQLSMSPSRGTGQYRIPTLHGVGTRGRLLHTGEFTSIEEMFAPDRDPNLGHAFGLDLSDADRTDLLDYLRQL